MELLTFAIDDAYPEAICRGYRMNMLKKENYDALAQVKPLAQVQQGDSPKKRILQSFLEVNYNTL